MVAIPPVTDLTETLKMTDKKREMSPREIAMEQIANANRTQLNAQIKEGGGTSFVELNTEVSGGVVDPDANPDDAIAEAARKALEAGEALHKGTTEDEAQLALQKEQQEAADTAAADAAREAEEATGRAAASSIDPKAKLKLKVNGQEMELTGEEALRRLQKDVSADMKLEQASQTLREAQELQRSVQEQQRIAAEAEEAKTKGGNPDGVQVDADIAKKFTEALFKGDSVTATQAFNEAVSSAVSAAQKKDPGRGQAATPVDPNAIAAQVRQQIAFDSALERSRTDYPDLYADPDIEAVAAAKIERAVKGGKPFITALDEVSGEMAKKFGWKKPTASGRPAPAANSDRRAEKLAAKEQIEQPLGGPAVKSGTQEDERAPVQDVIKEMAKARGQIAV